MDDVQDSFPAQAHDDVFLIHRNGFSLDLEAMRVPALAELGKTLAPQHSSGEATEHVLNRAIVDAAAKLTHYINKNGTDIAKGLVQLFGLPEDSPRGLDKRRARAAPWLGYVSAGSLRHGKEDTFEPHIVDTMTECIVEGAEQLGFTYKALFHAKNSSVLSKLAPKQSPETAENAQSLVRAAHNDLKSLQEVGFGPTIILPTIAMMCYIRGQGGYQAVSSVDLILQVRQAGEPERLETFITEAVEQLPGSDLKLGAIELLGIGRPWRQLALETRRARACIPLGYENGRTLWLSGGAEDLLEMIAEKAVELTLNSLGRNL